MYLPLFELFLWFIFVRRRKRKVSSLNYFLRWTLLNLMFYDLSSSSAFILENDSLTDSLLSDTKTIHTTFPTDIDTSNQLQVDSDFHSLNSSNSLDSKNVNNLNDDSKNDNNQDLPANQNGPFFRHTLFVSSIYVFAYSIVFVVGFVGNLCVITVVIRSPRMRNATNFFICNLALADMLVVVCCLPATLLGHLFVPWILGLVLCKGISYLQGIAVSASINTLVAVSIERFLAICFPFKKPMTRRKAKKWILVIWIISLIIASPWAIYFKLSKIVSYQVQPQASSDAKISAQQLVQNNSDIDYKISDSNSFSEFNNQLSKLNYATYQFDSLIDSNSTRQRKLSSPILRRICEFKRIAELSVLNSVYRFVLKLKFNLIYQLINQYSADTKEKLIKTIMDSSFKNNDNHIKLQLIKMVEQNKIFNDDQLDSVNLDQLNYFVQKQLSLITCECFDLSGKLSDLNESGDLVGLRNLSNDLVVNLKENPNGLDSLTSRRLSIQRNLSNSLNSTIEIVKQKVLNSKKLDKEINSANYRINESIKNKLSDLGNLEIKLLEQTKLKGELLCKLGCDLDEEISLTKPKIDQSLCNLIDSLSNQTSQILELNKFDNQIDNQLVNKLKQLRLKRTLDNLADSNNQTSQANQENQSYQANDYEVCHEEWPSPTLERVYFVVANLILCYLLPLIVISVCYICIWITVWQRSIPCETAKNNTMNSTPLNNTSITNTPITELPNHSCRLNYARKQLDQQSNASSSKSSKSLLANTFTGLKNNLFPESRLKNSVNNQNKKSSLAKRDDKLLKKQGLILKLNNLDQKRDLEQHIEDELVSIEHQSDHNDRINELNKQKLKKTNQIKNSLLVCSYDQGKQNEHRVNNSKQQILITIDSSPTNSIIDPNPNEPSNMCKRLHNKIKTLKKLLPNNRKPAYIYKNKAIVNLDADRLNDSQSDNQTNDQSKLRKFIRNDIDFQIELIDELDENLNSTSSSSSKQKRQTIDQSKRIVVKRALSKQSINTCIKCSNINNNCECKSHHHKQLVKPTKSTPITCNDRLTNRALTEKKSKRTNTQKLAQPDTSTSAQLNNQIELILQRSRLKVAKMMIIIILVFFLSWLPLYIIFSKVKLGLQLTSFRELEERIIFLILPFVQWICYINSCVNPVLYAFLNKKYRSEFVKLFSNVKCLRCLRKSKNKIKKQQQKQNTSTILKASVKSHHQPSSRANYDQYNQNFDTPKHHENYKRIVSKPNEFVLHYPTIQLVKKDDLNLNGLDDLNGRTSNVTMNRSRSEYELDLKNRKKISKTSSFSSLN